MHDTSPWPSEWPERTPLQTCSSQSYPSPVYGQWRSNSLKAQYFIARNHTGGRISVQTPYKPFTYRLSMDHGWQKTRKWYPTLWWMIKPHLLWFWILYFYSYRDEPLKYSQLNREVVIVIPSSALRRTFVPTHRICWTGSFNKHPRDIHS